MKTINLFTLVILIICIAQILLKYGMTEIGGIGFSQNTLFKDILKIFSNTYVIAGLILSVFSCLFWLVIISRMELGFALSLTSIVYIIIPLISFLLFKEPVSIGKFIGIFLITTGVALILRF